MRGRSTPGSRAESSANSDEIARFYLDRGRRLFQQENDREAIVELNHAIYVSPYLAEAHLLLGRSLLRNGRVHEAIDAFKIALWSAETAAGARGARRGLPPGEGSRRGAGRSRARARPRSGVGGGQRAVGANRWPLDPEAVQRHTGQERSNVLKSRWLWRNSPGRGFHEIQLNGKQLVFLFMAATVVSVVIFLCGVLVGRGVRLELTTSSRTHRPQRAETTPTQPPTPPPVPAAGSDPTTVPPPPAADELSYFNRLEKSNAAPEQLKPADRGAPRGTAKAEQRETPAAAPPRSPLRLRLLQRSRLPRSRPRRQLARTRTGACRDACSDASTGRIVCRTGWAGVRGADRRTERAERGRSHREATQLEGLRGVRADAGQRRAVGVPRSHRQVQYAPGSRERRRQTAKGRAVQALGHPLAAPPFRASELKSYTDRELPSRLSYALALASGALLALSFPKFGHAAVGLDRARAAAAGAVEATLRRAFVLGLLTGVIYFTGTLYWITDVMVVYGDLPRWVAGPCQRGADPVSRTLSGDLRAGRAPHRDRARYGLR